MLKNCGERERRVFRHCLTIQQALRLKHTDALMLLWLSGSKSLEKRSGEQQINSNYDYCYSIFNYHILDLCEMAKEHISQHVARLLKKYWWNICILYFWCCCIFHCLPLSFNKVYPYCNNCINLSECWISYPSDTLHWIKNFIHTLFRMSGNTGRQI